MKLGFSILFALACVVTSWMLGSIDGPGIWTVMIGVIGVIAVICRFWSPIYVISPIVGVGMALLSVLAVIIILALSAIGGDMRIQGSTAQLLMAWVVTGLTGLGVFSACFSDFSVATKAQHNEDN